MIRKIKRKDYLNFQDFCNKKDKHSDFYITQNNKRLFLTDKNICNNIFNNCLKKNDICLIKEENGIFKGVLIITGYVDTFFRKYMKIHCYDKKTINDLIQVVTWDFPTDLYIKVKNNNPIIELLLGTRIYNLILKKESLDSFKGFGFRLIGKRGQEVLLCRKYDARFDYSKKLKYVKEEDYV